MATDIHFSFEDRLRNVTVNVVEVERPDECAGCGLCAEVCPTGAVEVDDRVQLDEDRCVACSFCVQVCPRNVFRFYEVSFMELEPKRRPIRVPKADIEVRFIGVDLRTCDRCEDKPCIEVCPTGVTRKIIEEHRIDLNACQGCLECVKVCPHNSITIELEASQPKRRSNPHLNRELCVECNRCHEVCPTGAADNVPDGDPDPKRCLGCYNCVVYCPTEALKRPDYRPRPKCTNEVFYIQPDMCIGCRICYDVCPVDAIRIEEITRMPVIMPDLCVRCGLCADACPTSAVDRVPTEEAEREVLLSRISDAFLGVLTREMLEVTEEFGSTTRIERDVEEELSELLERRMSEEVLHRVIEFEVEKAIEELMAEVVSGRDR
ncbi:4Fe-4S binding protein [Methanopyrus sp.]